MSDLDRPEFASFAKPPDAPELERLRSFCMMLPEVTEVDTFGNATFRIATKQFAIFEVDDEGATLVCFKTTVERQAELVEDERFAPETHTGHYGWTTVRIDGPEDAGWSQIDRLVVDSYRLVAPDEFRAQVEAMLGL